MVEASTSTKPRPSPMRWSMRVRRVTITILMRGIMRVTKVGTRVKRKGRIRGQKMTLAPLTLTLRRTTPMLFTPTSLTLPNPLPPLPSRKRSHLLRLLPPPPRTHPSPPIPNPRTFLLMGMTRGRDRGTHRGVTTRGANREEVRVVHRRLTTPLTAHPTLQPLPHTLTLTSFPRGVRV